MSDGHEDGARPPGYRLMLREMAADERPREKLKLRGSAALSDGEASRHHSQYRHRGETVTDFSQRLLADHGGLRGLVPPGNGELARVRGLGDAKAVRVKAALELGGGWPRSPRRSGPRSAHRRTWPTSRHRDGGAGAGAVAGGAARHQAPHPGHRDRLSGKRQPGPGPSGRSLPGRGTPSRPPPWLPSTTTRPAIRPPRRPMSPSRSRSWQPGSCSTSSCSTTSLSARAAGSP